jgi:hypothetical protein
MIEAAMVQELVAELERLMVTDVIKSLLEKPQLCDCEIQLLMRSGCGCGGK